VENDKIRVIYVPAYESLTVAKIVEFCKENEEVMSFLPDMKEIKTLPKDFLMNLLYTINGNPFKEWVRTHCNIRNEKIANKLGEFISLDKKFADALKTSTHISSKSFAKFKKKYPPLSHATGGASSYLLMLTLLL